MPAPEHLAERADPRQVSLSARDARLSGWGRSRPAQVGLLEPSNFAEVGAALQLARKRRCPSGTTEALGASGTVPRGMGRSYGDAAQLEAGLVLDMTRLSAFELDSETGVLEAQAGAALGDLLRKLVPEGWMLPVVPGTQHVSVGGAFASDLHGKNHQTAGAFSRHTLAIGLLGSGGEKLELTHDDELFWATAGGMGLTGVILWARIQLRSIGGPLMSVDIDRVADLDGACAALQAPGGDYRVAWLDLLGSTTGRGIVTRADHLHGGRSLPEAAAPAAVSARAQVPSRWPAGLLRPAVVRAFNELRFRTAPRRARGRVESVGRHLFPLDALDAWPRLYGAAGFLQYQFVVPFGQEHVLRTVIERLRRRRVRPYLVVLKDFGAAGRGPLSFPIAGWTMAIDLPRLGPELDDVLDECDVLIAQAGGRIYLAKDARLRRGWLGVMYPGLERWRRVRDEADPIGLWRSDLALRTGLLAEAGT